jgi:hypothetical protein
MVGEGEPVVLGEPVNVIHDSTLSTKDVTWSTLLVSAVPTSELPVHGLG